MDKNKREILALIIIVCIGVNYGIYNFFIKGQFNLLEKKKAEYNQKKEKLTYLNNKNLEIDELQSQINVLKKKLANIDKIAPHTIDTPQLVYDFYAACGEYGVKGDTINFSLEGDNQGEQSNQTQNQNTNQNSNTNTSNQNSTSNSTQGQEPNSQDNTSSSSGVVQNNGVQFLKLTLELKIGGNKKDVINFIQNLNKITERRLNVKSISISYEEETPDGATGGTSGENPGQSSQENSIIGGQYDTQIQESTTSNGQGTVTRPSLPVNQQGDGQNGVTDNNTINGQDQYINTAPTNMITADIVFYQYVQLDPKEYNEIKSYKFYNTKIGFDSIPDLFK